MAKAAKKKPVVKKTVKKSAKTARQTPTRFFTVKNSESVVQSRSGPKANKRVKALVDSLVKHLHAFIKESKPTMDEWMAGINFLTRTGQLCNDYRQEYILLSDTLGVSMLVESLNNHKFSGETESTVLGPFHVSGAPRYENGANICLDGKGEPLSVYGRVTDARGKPIPGALLDVWQANEDGFYDVQQKGIQPDMNLRGMFKADAEGRYFFRSAYPRFYPIPSDGTVGGMLKALDRNPNRPAHLHFIVSAPGFEAVVTHIFTPDCPWLEDDAVFGVKESLIADFRRVDDPKRAVAMGLANPFREVEWNFALSKAKVMGDAGFEPATPPV
jgi:protocatechuate 3,4-dioxygenase beta subunit